MPFTFSHPAIIFPIYRVFRKWTSLTGLVIGSMAPDFEKFLFMKHSNAFSHSITGVFLFCLPVSLGLSFLFHLFVRDALIDNLPDFLRNRLYPYRKLNWPSHFRKHYLLVVTSALVGSLSHLFWDGFTHSDGFLMNFSSPFLSRSYTVAGLSASPFLVLQLINSLAGMLVVLWAMLQLPLQKVPERTGSLANYWLLVVAVTLGLVVLRVLVYTPDRRLEVVLTAMLAFLVSLVLTPLLRKPASRYSA
ncbi:DUF4184 family protein [Pontibacter beigongshangensis]|uniref:DUF4184 family protein n=1 Tax=Pontibacter beigongshangensis TaxID=2574733 RepID=UPI0016508BDE|nr:DUF4184 family protein [Pontibacter beigongshangensis]